MRTHTTRYRQRSAAPRPFFQAKLTVNTPGDAYEQEADRIADQVVQRPAPAPSAIHQASSSPSFFSPSVGSVQRKCAACEHEEKEKQGIQRKEGSAASPSPSAIGSMGDASGKAVPSIVSDVLSSGGGQPMESSTRQFMESRFGQDFSQVRIHTDSRAAESASAIQARAYTSGRDVVFGVGEYQPGSERGRRLLAHELVHVGQQGGGQSNWVLKAEETSEALENGCRKKTYTECPGTKDSAKRLEYTDSMSVINMGSCTLFLHGIDKSGDYITSPYLEISPNETKRFTPSKEAVDTAVACHSECNGEGVLSHPYYCA